MSTGGRRGEIRPDLVLGNGPEPPKYARVFSQASSLRFYTQYQEYKRSTEICNSGQSITRPLLSVTQLLPVSIRRCLSRTYFNGDELEADDLWEALAKHAECWEDDIVDHSIAAAEVARLVRMGNERTATDRVDAAQSRLETYFENPSVERVFRDKTQYKKGPASIISKSLVDGLRPPEFKVKVQHELDMRSGWKDKPDDVFDVVRAAALDWRTVELADKRRSDANGGTAGSAARKSSSRDSRKEKPKSGSGTRASADLAGHVFRMQKTWPCRTQLPSYPFPCQAFVTDRSGWRKHSSGGISWAERAAAAAATVVFSRRTAPADAQHSGPTWVPSFFGRPWLRGGIRFDWVSSAPGSRACCFFR